MEGNKPERKEKNTQRIIPSTGVLFREFILFCVVFLAIGIVASLFFLQSSPPPTWEFGEEFADLNKTSDFSIIGGENYTYSLEFMGKNKSIFLHSKYLRTCPGILLEDVANSYSLCVRKSGFYSNASEYLEDSSFVFYAPWMLYLKENFIWNVNRTVTFYPSNLTYKSLLEFNSKNMTKLFGRDAFEVSVEQKSTSQFFPDSFFSNSTYFIDSQKRILLKAQNQDTRIILISAPFELEK